MADRHQRFRGITKLEPGLYLVRARVINPRTGKERAKKRRVKCKSMEAAARTRDKLVAELLAGDIERAVRVRLRDFANDWLVLRSSRVRPSSVARYTESLVHINASLGDFYLDAIRPIDVDRWMADSKKREYAPGKQYSPATINGWLRVLRQIAREAERDRDIRDFTRGVRSLPEGRTKGPRGTALTPEQFRTFLRALRTIPGEVLSADVARALETLAWTGMRAGELLALRCSDYRDGELHLTRSYWRGHEGPTKTDDPRSVVVVEPLAEVLEAQQQWMLRTQHKGLSSGLMFPASESHAYASATRRKGKVRWYRSRTTLTDGLQIAVVAAGLPLISLHSLRRTYADMLRRAGVDLMIRRALAGWETETAQGIYERADEQERRAAGAKFVRLVSGTSSGTIGATKKDAR